MNIDWTEILLAVISLIGLLITGVLVPYIRANTTKKQRENIEFWVGVAVMAAEKHFDLTGEGVAKKEEVKKFLKAKGIKIPEEQLDKLIDFTVEKLINQPWTNFAMGKLEGGIVNE